MFYAIVGEQTKSDFHRSSLKMAGLHIYFIGIFVESTETTKGYSNFNDELRWLWNSVNDKGLYTKFCRNTRRISIPQVIGNGPSGPFSQCLL